MRRPLRGVRELEGPPAHELVDERGTIWTVLRCTVVDDAGTRPSTLCILRVRVSEQAAVGSTRETGSCAQAARPEATAPGKWNSCTSCCPRVFLFCRIFINARPGLSCACVNGIARARSDIGASEANCSCVIQRRTRWVSLNSHRLHRKNMHPHSSFRGSLDGRFR